MKISYIKTEFVIEPIEELHLPFFKGSTFRGVFGNTFRKVTCTLKRLKCENCILKSSCIYSYIFETPPIVQSPILNMDKYKTVPHPFILEPPLHNGRLYKKGEEIKFSLIIIGKAINYFPFFVYTFEKCGEFGMGKGRGKFFLKKVQDDKEILYDHLSKNIKSPRKKILEISESIELKEDKQNIESITINILTPIRIKHERKLLTELYFFVLIKSLMLRLNLIHYFHCEERDLTWAYKDIIEEAKKIIIKESNIRWFDWSRYSSRQGTKMKLGGIIGKITYEGRIKPYMEILKAGEIFHVGKNTTFGLGKYEII